MNILVKTVGGATFSKFMVALQSISAEINDISKIDNIYIEIDTNRQDRQWHPDVNINPFNFVLEQESRTKYDKIIIGKNVTDYTNHDKFLRSNDLIRFKLIIDKIKIKQHILNRVSTFDKDTLGVHIRLTDMPYLHPQYGKASTKDYVNKINQVIMDDTQIFVASDNDESLDIIKQQFKSVLYNDVTNRSKNGEDDSKYCNYLGSHMTNESHWIDSFVEMLSLAKCNELIYRPSNLNNFSIIYSDTITKTHLA